MTNTVEMVVQKPWADADGQQNVSGDGNSSWSFPQSPKMPRHRSNCTANTENRPPITRQLAINTLAVMHRRYSLPGPVQPFSRPISEFRASANKSLDLLRQTVQGAVTREIDQVIKKYLEKYFVPAVNNIRLNLGEECVNEDQVRAVCRAMLDATRILYATPARPSHSVFDNNDSESACGLDSKTVKLFNLHSPLLSKRKEPDSETEIDPKCKKIKEEMDSARSSPVALNNQKELDKWNPARLTQDTLFIMGSHAHKVLGLGNSRGRLYTKHSTLLRYPADSIDKEWIANHNLVNVVGGKTYIMVLEDIEELATSDLYRHNSLPMLGELTGFKVPPFMLNKIKDFVAKKCLSDAKSPITTDVTNDDQKYDEVQIIDRDKEYSDIDLTKDDFPEIKVDGIKAMDIDDIKVEAMGDVTVKIEHLSDSNEMDNARSVNFDPRDVKMENIGRKLTNSEGADLVNGLLDSDMEFLSKNIGNIGSDADARKTIEKITGANADTITLVGDEFDFGTTLNTDNYPEKQNTRSALSSTTQVNTTPITKISAPATLHYYRTVPSNENVIAGMNTKTGTLSTVMSQNATSYFGVRSSDTTIIGSSTQYLNVTAKTFSTGNILHNAIVSRNFINRTNFGLQTAKSNASNRDLDGIATTKDMIDNACNSSVMLKQVLTLGSSGTSKSFMMHNTQKVLSTGFATGRGPPNMTVVNNPASANTLSVTHATLSALLSSRDNVHSAPK